MQCQDDARGVLNHSYNSPIEERHIDYLLEEEFSTNPLFLEFFIKQAAKSHAGSARKPMPPSKDGNHQAFRSATTSAGESDVVVIYTSGDIRVGLLIEDKIDAQFQDRQAERYIERGDAGIGKAWNSFWTCLVAPEKYCKTLAGFDARVSLESLRDFFRATPGDIRSNFKANVIDKALNNFTALGPKVIDRTMTEFRAFYAQQAEHYFAETGVAWTPPRDAWWGDSWFEFRSKSLPRGSSVTHKTMPGQVHLSFRGIKAESLEEALRPALESSDISVLQTGKSASLQILVPPIETFTDFEKNRLLLTTAFASVDKLLEFWREHMILFQTRFGLKPKAVSHAVVRECSNTIELKAVQAMLHGLIKSRALSSKATIPTDLPNLLAMSSQNEITKWFAVDGMAGGFEIHLSATRDGHPLLLTQSGSRMGSGWIRHIISSFEIRSEAIDDPGFSDSETTFDEWVQKQRQKEALVIRWPVAQTQN